DVVRRERAHAAGLDRRALERAGLVLELGERGGELAGSRRAQLDANACTRGRARGLEHLLARHHELDRTPGLPRQRDGEGFQIDDGLAAETSADLRGRDPDLADVETEEPSAVRAHDEVPLRRAPELHAAV